MDMCPSQSPIPYPALTDVHGTPADPAVHLEHELVLHDKCQPNLLAGSVPILHNLTSCSESAHESVSQAMIRCAGIATAC